MIIEDITQIRSIDELLERSNWLVGKTMEEIVSEITESDEQSRVTSKAGVGDVIEKGFFGIQRNTRAEPDIAHLGVEIKSFPVKYTMNRTHLTVKEPVSLNMINYVHEAENIDFCQSSLYKKNSKVLFIVYIHEDSIPRSQYVVKYVFLWEMDDRVIAELKPDYQAIIQKITLGIAHEIHQGDHVRLTLCPKHNGTFKDPNCKRSKTVQPYSDIPAELRAYRLKNSYMNIVICRHYGFNLERGGWLADS